MTINWFKLAPFILGLLVFGAFYSMWNAYSDAQREIGTLNSDISVLQASLERQVKEAEILRQSAKATEEILVKEQDKRLEVEQQLSSSKASIAQLKKENNLLKRRGDNENSDTTSIELSDDATRLLHESFCRASKKHPDCSS